MKYRLLILALCAALLGCGRTAPKDTDKYETLRNDIRAIADSIDGELGVAVIFPNGDTMTFGNETDYPMMSVVKFPQALAVCDLLKKEGQSLTDTLMVTKRNLEPGTWSPLREEFPNGGQFSIERLLYYSLALSDNNVCSVLFDSICGVAETQKFVDSIGIEGFKISQDERMMAADMENCYLNSANPLGVARLFEYLYTYSAENKTILDIMANCQTGLERIPKGIEDAEVVHKTGTSGMRADGRLIAINDAGVVVLPDGRHYSLAVFVKDAMMEPQQAEEVIARVARKVNEWVVGVK